MVTMSQKPHGTRNEIESITGSLPLKTLCNRTLFNPQYVIMQVPI